MLPIYEYASAIHFLKDRWRERREADAGFSQKEWSRRLGLKGSAPLTLILQGKRPLPRHYLPLLKDSLKLNSKEANYLEALLGYNQARNSTEKDHYYDKIRSLSSKREVRFTEVESFKALADPLHTQILEITDLNMFTGDARAIQALLLNDTSLKKIEEILERLKSLGLLVQDPKTKKFTKTNQNLSNRPDIADRGSQEFHRRVAQQGQEALIKVGVMDREFDSFAFNISHARMKELKARIRSLVSEIINKFEAEPGQGETTVQFNVQLFPLTKKGDRR